MDHHLWQATTAQNKEQAEKQDMQQAARNKA
jgi:hypothetical protein